MEELRHRHGMAEVHGGRRWHAMQFPARNRILHHTIDSTDDDRPEQHAGSLGRVAFEHRTTHGFTVRATQEAGHVAEESDEIRAQVTVRSMRAERISRDPHQHLLHQLDAIPPASVHDRLRGSAPVAHTLDPEPAHPRSASSSHAALRIASSSTAPRRRVVGSEPACCRFESMTLACHGGVGTLPSPYAALLRQTRLDPTAPAQHAGSLGGE